MKKILLSAMCCLIPLTLSGCNNEKVKLYRTLDTDKAAEIALDYMNEKYDKTFCVISSEKDCVYGYVPGSIQLYWCEVELALKDSDSGDNYTVSVTLNDNGKDYMIEWDNYMTTLVTPLIKKDVNSIVSELEINDYFIDSYDICEIGTGGNVGRKGFRPDFNIDLEKDTLSSIMGKYDLWLCFNLYMPESSYKTSLVSEFQKTFESNFSQVISDDYIQVAIISFDDNYYSEIKKINECGNKLPSNHEYKAIHENVFKLG